MIKKNEFCNYIYMANSRSNREVKNLIFCIFLTFSIDNYSLTVLYKLTNFFRKVSKFSHSKEGPIINIVYFMRV